MFNGHYVIVHLTVQENGEKKALENPGGDRVLADLGGAKSGLPFYAFLDATGKKLADANAMPGERTSVTRPPPRRSLPSRPWCARPRRG